jgi:DNA-binding NtrC family response regulator
LINAIDRAKILANDQTIRLYDLPHEVATRKSDPVQSGSDNTDELSAIERSHVIEIMNRERGNKARAARALGLSRRSLYRLLEKYGIQTTD